jgi:hypothetical protein
MPDDPTVEIPTMPPPPQDFLPEPDHDVDKARFFASLVKNMLQEHEKRVLDPLNRLTTLVDLLVHDVRGLHLQIAAQGADVSKATSAIIQLTLRLDKLEQDVRILEAALEDAKAAAAKTP